MREKTNHQRRNFNTRKVEVVNIVVNSTIGPIRKKRNRMLYLRNLLKHQAAKEILVLVSHLIKP